MKKLLVSVLALVMGVGVGGASAYGVGLYQSDELFSLPPKMAFVPATTMAAPLVFSDGRLSAYISFDVQLEVPADAEEEVKLKMPLFMHAVNLRTYRAPLASGVDGMIPDIGLLRKVVAEAATETFGPQLVKRVVVTQASPI